MAITLIGCLDMNNGISDAEGNLLFNLSRHRRRFNSVTSGKVVVMGRKTWDSLPKKPLPKRKNYVVTYDEEFSPIGAKVIHSIEEIVELGKSHDVYVIGGGEIYHQTIEHADRLLLTQVHHVSLDARVFFPEFDYREWKRESLVKIEEDEEHQHSFSFVEYKRK